MEPAPGPDPGDATTGRYVSPDPLGMPDGPSRYAYVRNSPLMGVDPEGRQSFEDRREFTPIPNPFEYDPKVFEKKDLNHQFPTMFDPHIWYFGWFCGCGVSSEGLYYQRCIDGSLGGKKGRYELGMSIGILGGGSRISHRVFKPWKKIKPEPEDGPKWGWPID